MSSWVIIIFLPFCMRTFLEYSLKINCYKTFWKFSVFSFECLFFFEKRFVCKYCPICRQFRGGRGNYRGAKEAKAVRDNERGQDKAHDSRGEEETRQGPHCQNSYRSGCVKNPYFIFFLLEWKEALFKEILIKKLKKFQRFYIGKSICIPFSA